MSNEELYKAALEAIRDFVSDTSVSQADTHYKLQELVDEIRSSMEALDLEA